MAVKAGANSGEMRAAAGRYNAFWNDGRCERESLMELRNIVHETMCARPIYMCNARRGLIASCLKSKDGHMYMDMNCAHAHVVSVCDARDMDTLCAYYPLYRVC